MQVAPGVGNRKHDRHLRVERGVAMLLEVVRCIEIESVLASGEGTVHQLSDTAIRVGGAAADE